jgi:hypothetical protein
MELLPIMVASAMAMSEYVHAFWAGATTAVELIAVA